MPDTHTHMCVGCSKTKGLRHGLRERSAQEVQDNWGEKKETKRWGEQVVGWGAKETYKHPETVTSESERERENRREREREIENWRERERDNRREREREIDRELERERESGLLRQMNREKDNER